MRVDFSPPDVTEREIQAVAEALRSGWITTGPRTKAFERRLTAAMQSERTVCLQSQTISSELCLRALGIGPGDEVIVPAYTYTASASIVDHVGARLVMIDSQPDSVEMDYERLAAAVTTRTKAVIPVDVGGVICDYTRIFEALDSRRHLFQPSNDLQAVFGRPVVIADAAHSFGAVRGDLPTGCWADFSSVSFHAVKNLTTAEGGCLTWRRRAGLDSEALYRQFMLLSLHGQSKDALAKTKLGAWEYDIVLPGYKANMTDIMAAIGLVQLERYPELIGRRFEIARSYDAAFADLPLTLRPLSGAGFRSAAHLYFIRLNGCSEAERNIFIEKMAERDVACNVHYKPLPMFTAYRNLGFDIADYPNAFALYENEVTLPLHTRLSDAMVQYVADSVRTVMGEMSL